MRRRQFITLLGAAAAWRVTARSQQDGRMRRIGVLMGLANDAEGQAIRDGGLISYGVDQQDFFRQASFYVDRILRGAKVTDLPIQQPTKFELGSGPIKIPFSANM